MLRKKLSKYSDMIPMELRTFVKDAPNNYIDWALVMYLFENTKSGNIITAEKIGNFFDMDSCVLFERLDNMSELWVGKYSQTSEYGKIYYTYEITEIAADFIVGLVGLLEIKKKDKDNV